MAVRYALLSGHPRKQLNFTLDSLHAAESALKALSRFSEGLKRPPAGAQVAPSAAFEPVFRALADDLNTPAALGALFTAVNAFGAGGGSAADRAAFERVLYALGLDLSPAAEGDPVPGRARGGRAACPAPLGGQEGAGTLPARTASGPSSPRPAGPCWTARTATSLSP